MNRQEWKNLQRRAHERKVTKPETPEAKTRESNRIKNILNPVSTPRKQLRLLKGLDRVRRTRFITQLTWLNMLLTDVLKMDTELVGEEQALKK